MFSVCLQSSCPHTISNTLWSKVASVALSAEDLEDEDVKETKIKIRPTLSSLSQHVDVSSLLLHVAQVKQLLCHVWKAALICSAK